MVIGFLILFCLFSHEWNASDFNGNCVVKKTIVTSLIFLGTGSDILLI